MKIIIEYTDAERIIIPNDVESIIKGKVMAYEGSAWEANIQDRGENKVLTVDIKPEFAHSLSCMVATCFIFWKDGIKVKLEKLKKTFDRFKWNWQISDNEIKLREYFREEGSDDFAIAETEDVDPFHPMEGTETILSSFRTIGDLKFYLDCINIEKSNYLFGYRKNGRVYVTEDVEEIKRELEASK